VRVRFAPSPTGSLHIGSARTALYNFLFARHNGGSFVVRVEDTDVARSERRFEEDILDDLTWLGLRWDEGPDLGGPYGPYRQSERLEGYRKVGAQLLEAGKAYRCFCTQARLEQLRAERLAAGQMPKYDRRCFGLPAAEVERRMADGEPSAIRFAVPEGEVVVHDLIRGTVTFSSTVIGDFIIVRSDGTAGYNFAAAVDDRDMAITHVIRGEDHLTNTARQLMLFDAMGARPPAYAHHSLILGPDGSKLSKRHGATSVGEYRALGFLPQAVTNYLALLSWSHGEREVLSADELVAEFDLAQLSGSAAIFDRGKLGWVNHEYILAMPADEHERLAAAWLPAATPPPAVKAIAAAFKPSLITYGDLARDAAQILEAPVLLAELVPEVARGGQSLREFRAMRGGAADWITPDEARELLAGYRREGAQRGLKPRDVLMPLRIALTGCEHGPELHYVVAALSKAGALERIDDALERAGEPPDEAVAQGPDQVAGQGPGQTAGQGSGQTARRRSDEAAPQGGDR